MKNGIFETLNAKPIQAEMKIETPADFLAKIAHAQSNQVPWVETTPEIIKHFMPGGLQGVDYFIYHGIKVCEHGKSQEIMDKEAIPMNQRIHGASDGIAVGLT